MSTFKIPVIKTAAVMVEAQTLEEAIAKVDMNKGKYNPKFDEKLWELDFAYLEKMRKENRGD